MSDTKNMPRTKDGKPVLYKPFKSKKAGKKMSVYVKSSSGGTRIIHFGQKGADDWRSGTATKEQRKSYLARAKGIKKKDGTLAYKDKNSANYWAVKYLWRG